MNHLRGLLNSDRDMVRGFEPAFIQIHIHYHADRGEVLGVGLMEELGWHGYQSQPGYSLSDSWAKWKNLEVIEK